MKKIQIISALTAISFFALVKSTFAWDFNSFFSVSAKEKDKQEIKQEIKAEIKQEVKKEIKQEVKAEVKSEIKSEVKVKGEVKGEKTASPPGILKKLLNHVALSGAQVIDISGSSLTISKDNKTYTVETDGSTKFRRKFWGQSNIGEISVNDIVNVVGKWVDEAHTQIAARFVRDISIQKRFGVFFGKVTGVSGNGLVLETVGRGILTVTLDTNTKIVNRRRENISASDISAGHWIRARGLWDKTNQTLTQITEIKDFSLPGTTPAL